MSLIKKKIFTTIKNRIPNEILNLVFLTRPHYYSNNVPNTIDNAIDTLVFKPIVLLDLNIVGGIETVIDISKCDIQDYTNLEYANYSVITVPYSLTNGRSILSPLSLTFMPANSNMMGGSDNGLLNSAEAMLNHMDPISTGYVTSNLELIGPNTILVRDNMFYSTGYLRVTIENEDNLRNLHPKSAIHIAKLTLEAVKGYIYNKMVIEIDKGYVYAGHELNKFSEIIEKYEDAWEKYDELLEEIIPKIMFINNDEAYSRFIRDQINPRI